MKYPPHLLKLIQALRKLPGVGNKSAERFAFSLIDWPHHQHLEIADIIKDIHEQLKCCSICGCLKGLDPCLFCEDTKRLSNIMCVIASPKDAFAIEETHEYRGMYHVLGGIISPIQGKKPEQLTIGKLKERIQTLSIQELVIALDSTLEGDATALFLKQELAPYHLQMSRLAFGLPMGSSLDYIDGGTLARALSGRRDF